MRAKVKDKIMNTSTLIKKFKAQFTQNTGESLDFRKHIFIANSYGAYPTVSFEFGELVVTELYQFAHDFISNNEAHYPDFKGWSYNKDMEIDKLRSTTIEALVECVCETLSIHYHSIKVTNVSFEYDEDYGCNVLIDAEINGHSDNAVFTVQMSEKGEYEIQNGCWITTTGEDMEFSKNEQLMFDAYDVIGEAEKHVKKLINARYKMHDAGFNCAINSCNLYVREDKENSTFDIVSIDSSHNSACDYGQGMTVHSSGYDSLAEAMKYLNQFKTDDHHDFTGLSNAFDALNQLDY
jgi:hypothetical protein